ncbi:hypothetical protein C8F01DRAFT_1372196 [Mycena amicta]|nr:hypothetical protein C8F01DRAFT_1372196 [Mycena amicta]
MTSFGGAYKDIESTPSIGGYASTSAVGLSLAANALTSVDPLFAASTLIFPAQTPSTPASTSLSIPSPSTTQPHASTLPPPPSQPLTQPRASSPPLPPPSQPCTRLPAASLPKPKAPPLRLTQQMNSDWMGDHSGPSSTTPLHIRRVRNSAVDSRIVKRFNLVFWVEPGMHETALAIDNCPAWPMWQLAAAGTDVAELLEDDRVELYKQDRRLWFIVKTDFVHQLATDCTVFLRRRHTGWDNAAMEVEIARYLPPPPPHMRYNLPMERKAVREGYRTLKKTSPLANVSPLLPESCSTPPSPTLSSQPSPALSTTSSMLEDVSLALISEAASKRRLPSEDPSELQRAVRPRLTISTDFGNNFGNITFGTSVASTPALSSAVSSPWSSAPPTPISAHSPLPSAESSRGFSGMFVVDVVNGLNQIDTLTRSGLDIRGRFEQAFPGRRYVQATYNENKRKWDGAPAVLRESAIQAGRTPAGLWQTFTRALAAAKKG